MGQSSSSTIPSGTISNSNSNCNPRPHFIESVQAEPELAEPGAVAVSGSELGETEGKTEGEGFGGLENAKFKEDAEERERLIEEVSRSVDADPSLPNLFANFSKILPKPDLSGFNGVVDGMKDSWDAILKDLRKYEKYIGKEEIEQMIGIHDEYWVLLLKTKVLISMVVKKCKIQRRHVKHILGVLALAAHSETTGTGGLTEKQTKMHDHCIRKLSEWMEVDELGELSEGWLTIQKKLGSKDRSWGEKLKKVASNGAAMAKKMKKRVGILSALAGVALVAAVVAVSVATCGIGAVGAVATGAVLYGSSAIACAGAVAGGCAIGAMGVAAYKSHEAKQRLLSITPMKEISRRLKVMINGAVAIQIQINNMKTETKKAGLEWKNYLDSGELVELMKESLRTIDAHLLKFIAEGEKVVATVDDTCSQMINK